MNKITFKLLMIVTVSAFSIPSISCSADDISEGNQTSNTKLTLDQALDTPNVWYNLLLPLLGMGWSYSQNL